MSDESIADAKRLITHYSSLISTDAIPSSATIVAHRRTPPLFGLGFVDAVPDSDFFALATKEAARHDGTAGHVSVVTDLVHGGTAVGKFGSRF